MKVWEKIKTYEDTKNRTKDDIKNIFYNNRYIPCNCEINYNFIGSVNLNNLCNECKQDCEKCVEKYLDSKIIEQKEFIAMAIAEVRKTGKTNMFNFLNVINILRELDCNKEADYLEVNKDKYIELLKLSGKY